MAPGGTMARPNQPGNVQDATRRFGISSEFAPQRAPTQVQGASMVNMPFGEFKPACHEPGISVGSGDRALDSSFDHSIPPKPSRVMPPGMSDFHDNE
eukprot:4624010-Prymnesium_polylepis.1